MPDAPSSRSHVARGKGSLPSTGPLTWDAEDVHWRQSFGSRPYVSADRVYEYYQPALRYGFESASRYRGRQWEEVEPELSRGWETYEHRGESKSKWDEIKDAVRDGWDRVTGKG